MRPPWRADWMSQSVALSDLPELEIVPAGAVRPHEHVDPDRVQLLVDRLRRDGVLRNPPIVLRVGERNERFVVLDGATRMLAVGMLGLPHILVQVVHAGATSVTLETWNHVLREVQPVELLGAIENHPELALVHSDEDRAAFNLSAGGTLAYLALRGGQILEVVAETEPLAWCIANLNRLVGSYQGRARVERVPPTGARGAERMYAGMAALVVFRRLEIEDVVRAAAAGHLLPAGLTRFVVSPRALRVNYPLEELASPLALEAKQERLGEWVRERVAGRHVRYYAEATYLFDE